MIIKSYVSLVTFILFFLLSGGASGFKITQSPDRVVSVNEVVFFSIKQNDVVTSNTTRLNVVLDCGDSVKTVNDVDIVAVPENQVSCKYSVQGNYTVVVNITNDDEGLPVIFQVYVWELLNISLSLDNKYVSLNKEIPLKISSPPVTGLLYKIDFGNGKVLQETVEAVLFGPYSPIALTGIVYDTLGNYTIVFEAHNYVYHVEQNICISVVKNDMDVVWSNSTIYVGSTYPLNVSVSDVPETSISVNFGDLIVANHNCTNLASEYQFENPGHYIIRASIFNQFGLLSENRPLDVIYSYNGLTFVLKKSLIETTELALFYLTVKETINLPMGNVSLEISPCGKRPELRVLDNETLTEWRGTTQIFNCSFTVQGNYTVQIQIETIVGTGESLSLEIFVYDILNVSLDIENEFFAVGSNPHFQITDPPPSGFKYLIDFGEGTVLTKTDSAILTEPYSNITLPDSFNYIAEGNYTVRFKADNGFYYVHRIFCVSAEYGIPASVLETIPNKTLITPDDSLTTFKIFSNSSSSVPKPSNVLCDIDYGDGTTLTDEPTDFDFDSTGLGLTLQHNYTTAGTYDFVLNCSNKVSNILLTKTIKVIQFDVDSFNLSYNQVNLQNDSESGVFTIELQLYDLLTPPHNIKLVWDFNDGSATETEDPLTSFKKQHTYSNRGQYQVKLDITYAGRTRNEVLDITTGAYKLKLKSSKSFGLVNDTVFSFLFTNGLPSLTASIDIYWGDGTSQTLNIDANKAEETFTHTFITNGIFTPRTVVTNSKGSEFSLLENTILVQNEVKHLKWSSETEVVTFVPFTPEIHYSGSLSLINVICSFKYDGVTKVADNLNFTTQSPSVRGQEHTFEVSGTEQVSVNCSNLVSWQSFAVEVDVVGHCFTAARMFDRSYRHINTSLRAYTSALPILSEHIAISEKCENSTKQTLKWTIAKQRNVYWIPSYAPSPDAGLYDLAMANLGPGVFKISCVLTVYDEEPESVKDYMYAQLINPPLVAGIAGGKQRVFRNTDSIVLDALSESYDPVVGYGKSDTLAFSWRCFEVVESDLDVYLKPQSNDSSFSTPCPVSPTYTGLVSLPPASLANNSWFLFQVTVTKDSRSSTALQAVYITTDNRPEISLMCKWNCEPKINRRDKLIYEAQVNCTNCTETDLQDATYHWFLYQYNKMSFDLVSDIDSHIVSEKLSPVFMLDNNFLTPGQSYKLKVTVSNVQSRPEAWSSAMFIVNEEPYGGSCKVTPLVGVATVDNFTFACQGWMDEGPRDYRNSTADVDEPLTYVITQIKGKKSSLIYVGNDKNLLQKLDVCPEDDNYMCSIEFRIRDLYRGEAIILINNVKVTNPSPDIPPMSLDSPFDPSDGAQPLVKFLKDAEAAVKRANKTRDSEAVAKTATAFLTAINTMVLPAVTSNEIADATLEDGDVNKVVTNALTFLTVPNPQIALIQETTAFLTDAILDSVRLLTEEPFFVRAGNIGRDGNVLPTTLPSCDRLIQLTSSLAATIDKPEFVKPGKQVNVSTGLAKLSKIFLVILNHSRDIGQVENAIETLGEGQSNLNKNQGNKDMVEELEDLEGSEVFVNRNLSEGEKKLNPLERKYMRSIIKKKKQVEREKMQIFVSKTLNDSYQISDGIFKLMSRVGRKYMEQESFSVALDRGTVEEVLKGKRPTLNGAGFDFGAINSSIGQKENIKLELRVMKENIYSDGANAKYVTAPVTVARVAKQDGSSLPLSKPVIKQSDPVNTPYTLITPKFIEDDAAKMFYHSFFYRSLILNFCVSVLPVDGAEVVYDVFFRAKTPPTDMEYDYFKRDEAEAGVSGTNLCFPPDTFKTTGRKYMALRPRLNKVTPAPPEERSADTQTTSSTNTTSNETNILETPYMLRTTTASCVLWEEEAKDWNTDKCEFRRDEMQNLSTCICPDADEVVASISFFVAPNKIDFSTVFSKIDIAGQAAVLSTLIIVFVVFVVAALFSRYKDGQDVLQWGVSLLADNFRDDCYFYLITVYTGMIRHGGTKSKIEFNISGENAETGIRVLTDGVRRTFTAGSVMHFVMAVPESLGRLQCLGVWHDNSGKGTWASWYLNRIEVVDLQTKEKNDFFFYKWLAVEVGHVEAAVGAGDTENMKDFKTLFYEHARLNVTDDHLWLSTVLRPVKSHFSRVQRVGCCLALLLLTMIANAMFFQRRDFKDRKQTADVELGPLKFNLSQLWISFVSALVTAVPLFVMMFLFRKSKLSKSQTSTEEYTSHWMSPCFKRFKFYKDSVALQKALVVRDIVDDEDSVLPHFCVYIAWVLVAVSSLASAFFVFLYSAEWGKDVSEEWLSTFFLSFAQSLFVVDPVKIIILSVIFAMILKSIKIVRPTVYDLEFIKAMNAKNGKAKIERRTLDYISPFSKSQVKAAQIKAKKREKLNKALSEFLVTVFLLLLLATICYSNRDPHSFLLRTTLENQLMKPGKPLLRLSAVRNVKDYYHWLNYTVMDAMFPVNGFNYGLLDSYERLLMSDLSNLRVGAPRLRLVREKQRICSFPYIGKVKCILPYSMISEDTDSYCMGWNTTKPCDPDEGLKLTHNAWTFKSALEIWGLPIVGKFNVYGGGGYIAELDINRPVAKKSLEELIQSMWIDRQTRAVFLEFTVYSGNLNMFAYISLLSEFPETGSLLHFTNIYTFRSLGVTGNMGVFTKICEVLFLLTTVVWLVVIVLRVLKERGVFFKQFWNILELATVGLSFAAVVLYFFRLRFTNEALTKFRENTHKFVNFYHIAMWDSIYIYVAAILIAIVTIRLIKVMGYSRFTRTVFIVLKQSSKTLPGFFFYIILILFAFAICGHLFFGPFAKEYKDIVTCLESLFSAVLGHAGFTKMTIPAESSWFGLIYFITFIVMVTFTLSNIFMSILLDTMDMLGTDRTGDKELELTTFLLKSARDIISGKKEDLAFKRNKEFRLLMSKKQENSSNRL